LGAKRNNRGEKREKHNLRGILRVKPNLERKVGTDPKKGGET